MSEDEWWRRFFLYLLIIVLPFVVALLSTIIYKFAPTWRNDLDAIPIYMKFAVIMLPSALTTWFMLDKGAVARIFIIAVLSAAVYMPVVFFLLLTSCAILKDCL